MLRSLYRCALRLHPPAFRKRFGDEMLSIFDHAKGIRAVLKLFLDALFSLSRQWMLRPEFWREAPSAAAPQGAPDSIPSFYTISRFRPRSAALINGLALSLVLFCVTCFAIRYSGIHVLHVRIPEVQFERPSWNPSSPATSGMSPSLPTSPLPPQRLNKEPASPAVAATPALPQAPPRPGAVVWHRSVPKLRGANPARAQNNSQISNQGLRTEAGIEPPLHVYEGSYAVDPPSKLTVVITTNPEDKSLMMSLSGQPRLLLTPLSETKFAVQGVDNCWVEFVPGDHGPGSPMGQFQFSCNGLHYLARRR